MGWVGGSILEILNKCANCSGDNTYICLPSLSSSLCSGTTTAPPPSGSAPSPNFLRIREGGYREVKKLAVLDQNFHCTGGKTEVQKEQGLTQDHTGSQLEILDLEPGPPASAHVALPQVEHSPETFPNPPCLQALLSPQEELLTTLIPRPGLLFQSTNPRSFCPSVPLFTPDNMATPWQVPQAQGHFW